MADLKRAALKLNPEVFFVVHEGALVVWNVRLHTQHELSTEHLEALLSNEEQFDLELLTELVETNVLVPAGDAAEPWGWDKLSQLFHLGTAATLPRGVTPEPEAEQLRYLEYCRSLSATTPADQFSYRRGERSVSLAGREAPASMRGLVDILGRRASSRTLGRTPIELDELALVVSETFRYRPHDQAAQDERRLTIQGVRRSSPSGGSLQSCEAYVIAFSVNGLEPGLYHYWSDTDALGRLGDVPKDPDLFMMMGAQAAAADLSAAILITCRFDKLWWKYPSSRALRVAYMDAGHLSQTAQVVATGLGLRTWVTGYFFDPQVREYLQVNDTPQHPLLLVGLGDKGPVQPFDRYARSDAAPAQP